MASSCQWSLGGVHIAGTQIWCDAPSATEICFLSSPWSPLTAIGDLARAPNRGQVIATSETLALLNDGKPSAAGSRLPSPLGRPFAVGDTRLELVAGGFGPGSASLLIETDRRILYAAGLHPEGILAAAAQPRPADALILRLPALANANQAHNHGDDSGHARALEQAVEFALHARLDNELAAFTCDHPLAALALSAALSQAEIVTKLTPEYHVLAKRLVQTIPIFRNVTEPGGPYSAIITSTSAPKPTSDVTALRHAHWGRTTHNRSANITLEFDPHPQLEQVLRYIEQVAPRTLYVAGNVAEELASALAQRGIRAHRLDADAQLGLFG